MRVVVFERASGKVLYQIVGPDDVDTSNYESAEEGAVAWDTELDPSKDWWVTEDDPIPGATSITQVPAILIPNFYFDWATHTVLPDVSAASIAARERVNIGRDLLLYGNFTWSGNEFVGTAAEQTKIRNFAFEAFLEGVGFSVDWRLANGSMLTLNATDMLAVFAAMQAVGRSAQDQGNSLLADIDAAAAITPAYDAVVALNAIGWVAP